MKGLFSPERLFVKLETIIWDMDGTLADSTALHYAAWKAIMAGHGIDYRLELFLTGYGRNNFEILAEQFPGFSSVKIGEVSEEKEHAFRRLLQPGSLALLPGVAEWLQDCHQLGLRQVVGSSAPMANIAAMLHVLGVADYFQAILSGYRVPRGKPDPLLFLRCAAAMESDPGACLVIEDSIYGIEAAQRAGMPSIAVGALARSEAIQPYLQGRQPACTAVAALTELAPQQILSFIL
jgi:HAD superfamily hydrolase (TIGR01509 family)